MKKMLSMLLIVVIGSGTFITMETEAATFPDVVNSEEAIEYLVDEKIIQGYPDGTFKPKRSVTRLQAVRMLLKAQGVTDLTAPDPNMIDMPLHANGYDTVAKAVQLGLISGKKNADGTTYFDPGGHLTRAQMAKIIVEAQNLTLHAKYSFIDVPTTSGYYNYVSTLAATRITEGYEDGTYRPNTYVSREHFSLFIARLLDDSFKPAQPTFINDNKKAYSWKYYEEGKTFESTSTFVEMRTIDGVQWQLWKESEQNSDDSYFILHEDDDGLFEDACFSLGGRITCDDITKTTFNPIRYPLIVQREWTISSYEQYVSTAKIKARNQTVIVPAGKFTGVVVIEEENGMTYYYAPEVGLIKSEDNGLLFSELVKLQNN